LGNWLRSTYSFSIPSDATVTGVEVRVYAMRNTAGHEISGVRLMIGSTAYGLKTPYDILSASLANYTYGTSIDMWSAPITPAVVNGGTLGFEFEISDEDGSVSETTSVDAVWINVHYTPAAAPPTTGTTASLLFFLEGD
jgi:hypothetical protein